MVVIYYKTTQVSIVSRCDVDNKDSKVPCSATVLDLVEFRPFSLIFSVKEQLRIKCSKY